MRDGEQSPGASMSLRRKAGTGQDPRGDGGRRHRGRLPDRLERRLRGRPRDLQDRQEEAWSAAWPAPARPTSTAAPRRSARPSAAASTFLSTSPVHMKHKLQMEPGRRPRDDHSSVTRARNLCDDVEWSAEDATRTDSTSCAAASRPRSRPAPRRSTCPTRSATPIRGIRRHVPRRPRERAEGADKVIFSTHCHNDLGLAVANSLAGVRRAARGRSNAPSTASASGPATRRWKRS
jgi:2-isopropylmalate synthase